MFRLPFRRLPNYIHNVPYNLVKNVEHKGIALTGKNKVENTLENDNKPNEIINIKTNKETVKPIKNNKNSKKDYKFEEEYVGFFYKEIW